MKDEMVRLSVSVRAMLKIAWILAGALLLNIIGLVRLGSIVWK
jgi:hypothetical protein